MRGPGVKDRLSYLNEELSIMREAGLKDQLSYLK